jgi:hypothetical protein
MPDPCYMDHQTEIEWYGSALRRFGVWSLTNKR